MVSHSTGLARSGRTLGPLRLWLKYVTTKPVVCACQRQHGLRQAQPSGGFVVPSQKSAAELVESVETNGLRQAQTSFPAEY